MDVDTLDQWELFLYCIYVCLCTCVLSSLGKRTAVCTQLVFNKHTPSLDRIKATLHSISTILWEENLDIYNSLCLLFHHVLKNIYFYTSPFLCKYTAYAWQCILNMYKKTYLS